MEKVQAVFVADIFVSFDVLPVVIGYGVSKDCSAVVFTYFTSLICFWYEAEDLTCQFVFSLFLGILV